MRILMVSDVYFPRINGVSTSIQTFRRDLRALGHEVDLIAPAYPGAEQGADGIARVASRFLFFDPEDRMMRPGRIKALLPDLRARGYDLVHIQTPFVAHYAGLWLARALDVPTVETYHTHFEEYLFHYLPWLPRSALRLAARRFARSQCNAVDALVVPSRPLRDVLSRYGVRVPIHILPTGLDLRRFAGGDGPGFRASHGISPQRPVLIHIGRLAHEKNIDFLLHMLARVRETLPDVLLVVAGEGPARGHLSRLSRQLGLEENTLFVGYLDRARELLDCYRAGDAFVFASHTETQGLVLLEAMALGVPVVSTAHLGTHDILDAGRGALVARNDVDDFAAKVLRILLDPQLRATLGADACDYARTWSAPALAGLMATLYQSLIERRREPAVGCA